MQKIKILVADDVPATIKFYDRSLNDRFFEKTFARDGRQALEEYEKTRPDIIVLDMMMPVVS